MLSSLSIQSLSFILIDLQQVQNDRINIRYNILDMKRQHASSNGHTKSQSQASYERLMLDLMTRLINKTQQNYSFMRDHMEKSSRALLAIQTPLTPKKQFSTSIDLKRSNLPPLKQESYETEKPHLSTVGNPIIKEVFESQSGNNWRPKSRTFKHGQTEKYMQTERLHNQGNSTTPVLQKILFSLEKITDRLQKLEKGQTRMKSSYGRRKISEQIRDQKQEELDLIAKALDGKFKEPPIGSNPNTQNNKSNYGILTEILPYSDRRQIKVKFKLEDIMILAQESRMEDLLNQTAEWLGMVYRATASICWNMLVNNYLNVDQVKILFTQNIIFNFIQYMKEMKKIGKESIMGKLTKNIREKSVNILDYLCRQYPQTKIEEPNLALRNILPQIDKQGKIKYGVIWKAGVSITYREDGNYTDLIMKILNFMVEKSNQQYDSFHNFMNTTFEQVFLPIPKRKKMQQGIVDDSEPELTPDDLKYREKVKGYTKYLIGRKIHKNTMPYSQEEIQYGIFFVKSNAVLRIITKWVGELKQNFLNPDKKIKYNYHENKDHYGNVLYLSALLKNGIQKKIQEIKDELFLKIKKVKQECQEMEHLLTAQDFTTEASQVHLSAEQISVGMYSVNVKRVSSSYICSELNNLIHYLLKIPTEVNEETLGNDSDIFITQARKDLDNVNLVSLKLFDLLRCKISSNEEQIIWLVKYLTHQSKYNSKQFRIVRVKDRLSTGTRDIMINAEIEGGLVCEIQLLVAGTSDKKQELLDSYNHFLYELKRSELGPINENVSIWSNLEQRYSYFQQMMTKRNKNKICHIRDKPIKHKCGVSAFVIFQRPLICSQCNTFYPIPRTCLLNVICDQCKTTLCGQCYYYNYLDDVARKQFIFNKYKLIKENVMSKLKEYTDYTKPFPTPGIFIKKGFLNKEISFYMAIQKNKQEGVKNNQNIQIEIIQTIIRSGQILNRQVNKKDIEASLVQGQFFIKNYEKTELNNFIIFYFDKDETKTSKKMMMLADIKTQLEKPQNSKVKVLNIMKQPCYVNKTRLIRKQNEKIKQLNELKEIIPNHKIVVYTFPNYYLLAQVMVKGSDLRADIKKKVNMNQLQSFAVRQAQIVNMEYRSMTTQLEDIKKKFQPILYTSFCQHLRKIFLSSGKIKSIKYFEDFTKLHTIFISQNQLTSLEGIQKCQNLVSFTFDHNQVVSLEPLYNSKRLKFLSGNMNKIKYLKGLQNITDLKSLSVYENEIQCLDQLKNLVTLEVLIVRQNPITDLSVTESMVNLKKLFIGKTKPNVLPDLSKLSKLEVLSLQGLNLDTIPAFISKLQLKDLSLARNNIKDVSGLENQSELLYLTLAYNQISSIQNFDNLDKVKVLKLRHNNITVVKGFHDMESLRFVGLRQNPIDDLGDIIKYQVGFKYVLTEDFLTETAKKQLAELKAENATSHNNTSSSED